MKAVMVENVVSIADGHLGWEALSRLPWPTADWLVRFAVFERNVSRNCAHGALGQMKRSVFQNLLGVRSEGSWKREMYCRESGPQE